jgi:hypothetical protein
MASKLACVAAFLASWPVGQPVPTGSDTTQRGRNGRPASVTLARYVWVEAENEGKALELGRIGLEKHYAEVGPVNSELQMPR